MRTQVLPYNKITTRQHNVHNVYVLTFIYSEMSETLIDDLVEFVRKNKEEEFRNIILRYIKEENIMHFIIQCRETEIKRAAGWCKKENIYLIHQIFKKVENLESISFLSSCTNFDKLDKENRTWLHLAVIYDRDIEILRFLVKSKGISIESEDDYAYTPLHYYCLKETYNTYVLILLMKNPIHLTKPSKDGLTPLEFACSSPENLDTIQSIPGIDMKYLLRSVDNISKGIMEVEKYVLTTSFSTDRIWLNLLQKNDKYMLMSYIKNDDNFVEKYYLEPYHIFSIMRKCPENGQGILSYIKSSFFKSSEDTPLNVVLSTLTGLKIKESTKQRTYYKSALFLALITGRFQLISPLLRCCQFEIISYAMLTCLICQNLKGKKGFPDQVVKDIIEIKDFCEEFAIGVMSRTYNKDLSKDKTVTNDYINKRSDHLYGKSVMEIAHRAECCKYLGLPSCQESMTKVWKKRNFKCPQIKFWLHSLTHVIFLIFFSYLVINRLFFRVCVTEYACYVYGLGYLVEELRQIYCSSKEDNLHSYSVDAANIIDILGLGFMLISFILRMSLRFTVFSDSVYHKDFTETRNLQLFILRFFLCLSLISFILRVLYFASINKYLGPKLEMINKMIVRDLSPLLFIFFIFLISFGVTFQSLLFPNSFYTNEVAPGKNLTFDKKNLISTVGDIFRRATFTVFDFHYTLDEIENNRNNYVSDHYGKYAVYFLLLIFMVIVNVMLMNLLIALFSYTVTKIITESKLSWKRNRYEFIHEYWNRTIVPPPFNIIIIPFEVLIQSIISKKKNSNKEKKEIKLDKEDTSLPLVPLEKKTSEETIMSYYVYQAFSMSDQRYRLLKESKDLEYEKEIHFRNIEKKLKTDNEELKKLINENAKIIIENQLKAQKKKVSHRSISSTAYFKY